MDSENRADKTIVPPAPMLNWFTNLVHSRFGLWGLATISFLESALPIPLITDPFLVAAILVHRAQALRLVLVATAASVVGGIIAYYLAYFAFDLIARFFSADLMNEVNNLIETNTTNTLALTLIGAITPVPYTVVAWVVAALKANPLVFIIGSIIGRGTRYGIVGYCSYKFGPLAVRYARRYIALTSVLVVIVVALYIWLKM
jgi:membrane protein YqaA with SNARE-associated domain